jgi:hypothetical protein
MEKIEIQNFEGFVTSFFCANIDLFYLGKDKSSESEAAYVEEVSSSFFEILEQISNEEFNDIIVDFDIALFLHSLFSNTQEAKRKYHLYCLKIGNIEEKIVISAYMKYMINMTQSPTSKQFEYLNSFITDYGLLEFEPEIQNLYNSIRKDKESDIIGDW